MTHDPIADGLSRERAAVSELMAALGNDDDAELRHDMIEGETSLFEAISAAVNEIDQCEIIAAGCKAKESEVKGRRARAEGRAERVRAMIERAMTNADLPTCRLATATLTLRSLAPKPIVSDESLIPSEFWKPQPPALDKTALNAAAKLGPVPGVDMSNGSVSLTIRRS